MGRGGEEVKRRRGRGERGEGRGERGEGVVGYEMDKNNSKKYERRNDENSQIEVGGSSETNLIFLFFD